MMQISKKIQRLIDAQAGKSKDKEDHDEDDDEDDLVDRISFSDAYWFPVLGSVMLGGLYLLFKVRALAPRSFPRSSRTSSRRR
jgi:hypothetical protein